MDRVIDPLIADLQSEYANAIRHGRVWKSRWVLIAGYIAFVKAITLCGCVQTAQRIGGWVGDDHWALGRTVVFSVVATAAVEALLLLVAGQQPDGFGGTLASRPRLIVYLIPSALPLAVPMGFTLGVLSGLRGRVVSRRSVRAVLVMAVVCSAVSLATLTWVIPATNEAFRESAHGVRARSSKGVSEMTLIEISQRIASDKDAGVTSSAILMFGYHARWALSCATIFLALFALSLLKQRHVERWAVGVAASGAYVSYYFILFDGRVAALDGTLPAFAAAWMPNVVFAVASIALFILSAARSSPRSSA